MSANTRRRRSASISGSREATHDIREPKCGGKRECIKQLWTKIARFAEALEGMDDPTGHYMFSIGKRVEKLECGVEHLERQLHSRPGGSGIQQ
jgi:hypothetical protein